MNTLKTRVTESWLPGRIGILITLLGGLAFYTVDSLVNLSYDLAHAFVPPQRIEEVIILSLDELSYNEMKQSWDKKWDRGIHADLLLKLRDDGCKLVVMDIFLTEPGEEDKNAKLAKAIRENGKVVLAAERVPFNQPGLVGEKTVRPLDIFTEAADGWGIARITRDSTSLVREHYSGSDSDPSLPWAAAEKLPEAWIRKHKTPRMERRWVRYYGAYENIPTLSYSAGMGKPPGFFRDKVVFVGGKPRTRYVGEEADEFRTPYTLGKGDIMPGVEIEATCFLNLVRGDWIRKAPAWLEVFIIAVISVLFGYGANCLKPLPATGISLAAILILFGMGVYEISQMGVWFAWIVPAAIQIPLALGCAILLRTRRLEKVAEQLTSTPVVFADSPRPVGEAAPGQRSYVVPSAPALAGANSQTRVTAVEAPMRPSVPDHEIVGAKPIGGGAYGEVWLARNIMGTYRAAKFVFRSNFRAEPPYEREFKGIQKYEPISRSHPGLVQILQMGRNDPAGYFYYVMELGDDETSGQNINPEAYSAKNVAKELEKRKRLPIRECVDIGVELADALTFLHKRQLIHRDIKPSNIIFVNGRSKFADIGLVTEMREVAGDATYLGTEGYIAPEGPGTAGADIFSLGKVLYEMLAGPDKGQFPSLPSSLGRDEAELDIMQLNKIILKACERNPIVRYQNASELHAALLALQMRRAPA